MRSFADVFVCLFAASVVVTTAGGGGPALLLPPRAITTPTIPMPVATAAITA